DSNQLAEKIKYLFKNKNELNKISENAYNWSKEFNWDKSAEHFLNKVTDFYHALKTKI
ncbi:MAG: glycosyltransferase, partial [Ignavibacteriae bacterium]|nr:glycosyltransferase [Ignavibacteriota bacterium]